MLEIYNDNLRDLLGSDPTAKLDIMTAEASGENVPGVVCEKVHRPADVLRIMAHGAKNRCAPAHCDNTLCSSKQLGMCTLRVLTGAGCTCSSQGHQRYKDERSQQPLPPGGDCGGAG